jgi:hypothetical protein
MLNPCPVRALAFSAILVCAGLSSCGPTPDAGGGIGGTGSISVSSVSSGVVTKLSSVNISGTEYDTSNALYCMDGEPCSTEKRLKVGMVVLVRGTVQLLTDGTVSRVADTITFDETVEGVLQSVAPDGSSLVILGQFIEVNQHTVIGEDIPDQSIRNLKPGLDVVVVSGLVAAGGHIVATLVMKPSGTPHFEVQGVIKNHDVVGRHFEIGQLVIDYSAADVSDMGAGGVMPWNDRLVHARGDEWQVRSEAPHGASLRAARVKPLSLTIADSAEAKLQGFITRLTLSGEFLVNNHPIKVSSATKFEGGTAEKLILGTHVFVHGALKQGVLEADEVLFK